MTDINRQSGGEDDPAIQSVANSVLGLIRDGDKVGLGSGRASTAFIRSLGARVKAGFNVSGVPTSEESARLAQELNIPLIELSEGVQLDLTVDGADEVAPNLDLVKGWGGALVRERIVAAASLRQIILVGPEKLVEALGTRGRIPVEVIPLAEGFVTGRLKLMGITPVRRLVKNQKTPFITDNGNIILDCKPATPLKDAAASRAWESAVLALAGVVDTGLFLGTAEKVLVGYPDGRVETLQRKA